MTRKPESVHTFEHDPEYRLTKEVTVVRCDDGSVYEFEKTDGQPKGAPPRLTKAFQPDGSMTHTGARKILPDAVEETVDTILGGWSK